MRIHVDWPWSDDVVNYGAPIRAYVHTRRWFYIVGARSQRWDPTYGYGYPPNESDWRFVTRHPIDKCEVALENDVKCPLEKGHESRHWNWKRGWKQTQVYAPLD